MNNKYIIYAEYLKEIVKNKIIDKLVRNQPATIN